METIICLLKPEEIASQQMGRNYSLLVKGFSGPGNDLRLVLAPEAAQEVVNDIQKILTAAAVQVEAAPKTKPDGA